MKNLNKSLLKIRKKLKSLKKVTYLETLFIQLQGFAWIQEFFKIGWKKGRTPPLTKFEDHSKTLKTLKKILHSNVFLNPLSSYQWFWVSVYLNFMFFSDMC